MTYEFLLNFTYVHDICARFHRFLFRFLWSFQIFGEFVYLPTKNRHQQIHWQTNLMQLKYMFFFSG